MSLLGHLAFQRFTDQREDLATEALGYILGKSDHARAAVAAHLERGGVAAPASISYATQVAGESQERPDIVGTFDDREVLIVEAKFWAGLTENQPVRYLQRLAPGGTLLFVAPQARLHSLWNELLDRCTRANVQFEVRNAIGEMQAASVERDRQLLLTSWRSLLDDVRHQVANAGESGLAEDVSQLRGLCDRMDEDAFLPLTDLEATSQQYRRIFDFAGLIDPLFSKLETAGVAERRGLQKGAGFGFSGRYCYLFGAAVFLVCDIDLWMKHGISPIWLTIYGDVASSKANKSAAHKACEPLRRQVPPLVFEDRYGFPTIPLRVPLGAERDRVIGSLEEQLFGLRALLAQLAVPPT